MYTRPLVLVPDSTQRVWQHSVQAARRYTMPAHCVELHRTSFSFRYRAMPTIVSSSEDLSRTFSTSGTSRLT